MAEGSNFKETVEALFQGMDNVVTSKTVVGDAIHINDTIILPLVDVSFGLGGRMTPSAVLVIQNGTTRLVNIKNQDTITKLLDMVPDVLDRFTSKGSGRMSEEDLNDILDGAEEEEK